MSDQPGDSPPGESPYGAPPGGQSPYAAPPPGSPPPTPPPAHGQQPPYGYPVPSGPYHRPKETEGYAIAVLVTAVCSFFVCPVVPAIVALALAPTARRNIAESGGQKDGESLVTAGVIVAWCNIGLAVLGLILLVVLLAVVSDNSNALGLTAFLT